MCSINGFNFSDEKLILKMNEATKHRGPDGTGFFIDENITFGHNLLAIADDPEQSVQPVLDKNKEYALTYNGEIYNYLELREGLKKTGGNFKTDCDTEVLFQGLVKEGIGFLEKIDGMYALAFYNKKNKILHIARDFSGMKPLYYYLDKNKIIFSSEIKGLLSHEIEKKINLEALNVYFSLGYVPGERTLIRDIKKVCPGQVLSFHLENNTMTNSWVGKSYRTKRDEKYNPDNFREMMGEAVASHTMGKRTYGLYLSGGLDSTLILHELSKINKDCIKTFTTRFDIKNESINEDADLAKKLCKEYKIDHCELLVKENDFIQAIEKTINAVEEPRYNFSLPAYWLLAKRASQDITVVLSGGGGDEVFLGYSRYLEVMKINERLGKYPGLLVNLWYTASALRDGKIKFGEFLKQNNLLSLWSYINDISRYDSTECDKVFKFKASLNPVDLFGYLKNFKNPILSNQIPDRVNAFAELDKLFWLADEDLIRTDKIMMAFSMEGRFPFLAKSVINYANNLPADEKIKNGKTKEIVRNAYRGYLPDYIIDKKKTGWYAPTVEWMHSDLGEFVKEVLSKGYYDGTADLFDLEYVRRNFVENVDKFTMANVKKFLPIFFFQIWAKELKIKI